MSTLRERYFEKFAENLVKATKLTQRKNEGYTAGSDDPYKNFRYAADNASLPGKDSITIEQTILSRISDKISRLKSLLVRPDVAYDESIEDTLMDAIVYFNIMLTFIQLGRPEAGTIFPEPEAAPLDENGNEQAWAVKNPGIVAKAGQVLADKFGWNKGGTPKAA